MYPLVMAAMTHSGHGPRSGRGGGRPHGRGGPGGPPSWASGWRGAPFSGFGFPFGPPRGRAGRGDVRAAVLVLLAEQPRHGYEIITEVVERSGGRWQPSPGSVYPVLKRLATDGLVRAETDGDRRVFELTDAGRAYVDEHADELGEPWAEVSGPPEAVMELVDAARQAAGALWQVVQTGNDDQIAGATAVLTEAKRSLYRVLAGDALDDDTEDPFVRDAVAEEQRSAEDEAFSDEQPEAERPSDS
jgi:DNA-binding PadR family transcriptional regulator